MSNVYMKKNNRASCKCTYILEEIINKKQIYVCEVDIDEKSGIQKRDIEQESEKRVNDIQAILEKTFDEIFGVQKADSDDLLDE